MAVGLQRSSMCRDCAEHRQQLNREAWGAKTDKSNKENEDPTGVEGGASETGRAASTETVHVKWKHLAVHISKCTVEEVAGVDLLITVPPAIQTMDGKARRVELAKEVLACGGYRFK
jgi:hypothetical protein